MADPTDDPTPPPPADDEDLAQAAMQAAELGMAKSAQVAQAAVQAAEAAASAFAEKDVSHEQLSAPHPRGSAPTSAVNSQASESVAMTNGLSGDGAPVIAEAGLAQVAAQAAGLALLNAVNAQQNAYVTANAAVAAIVARILALAPPAKGDRADG